MGLWKKKQEVMAFTGGKVCAYGDQGTGKSTFLGTFPNINLVDAEAGQAFYLATNKNIINVLPTTSAAEVQEALDELNDEDIINDFDSIGIDSGTKIYENMQAAAYEVAEGRAKKQATKGKAVDLDDLNLSQRDWGHIKRWNQQLTTAYILFSNLGKWTIVTAHLKDIEKEISDGKGGIKKIKIGERPDLPKKAEYDFDILIKLYTEKNDKTGEIEYYGLIEKDRTGVTAKGQIIKNPSFEIWKDYWENTRKYGTKNLDMSGNVEADRARFITEQEEEDEIVNDFKNMLGSLNDSDKKKMAVKLKELKIENPLKPKTREEIIALKNLIKEFDN